MTNFKRYTTKRYVNLSSMNDRVSHHHHHHHHHQQQPLGHTTDICMVSAWWYRWLVGVGQARRWKRCWLKPWFCLSHGLPYWTPYVQVWSNVPPWCTLVSEGGWVSESVSQWVSEGVSEWVRELVSESVSQWVSRGVSERVSKWVGEWVSVWVSQWVSAWVGGILGEWVSVTLYRCVLKWEV